MNLLGCDTVLLGEHFLTFQKILELADPENEHNRILQKNGDYSTFWKTWIFKNLQSLLAYLIPNCRLQ
jgi:hypothetical protein